MNKSVIIIRNDLFPEGMEIKEIQIGEKMRYYEEKTNQKGRSLDELLANVVKSKDDYLCLEHRVTKTLWGKIEGLGIKADKNTVRSLINTEEKAFSVVKEVFYGGYFKFSFPATSETIKIRITSQDFPELPKSIKRVVVDGGDEFWLAKDGKRESLGKGLYSFLNVWSLDSIIPNIVEKTDFRIQTNSEIIQAKISEKYFEKQYYDQSILLEKIWKEGIELEFEVSEEEVFPAL